MTREIDMRFSPISDPREKSPGAARTCSGAARCALRRGTHSLPKLRACPGMKGQLKQVAFKHRMENEAQGGGRTDHEAQRNQCGRGPCFWSPRRSRLGKNDPMSIYETTFILSYLLSVILHLSIRHKLPCRLGFLVFICPS